MSNDPAIESAAAPPNQGYGPGYGAPPPSYGGGEGGDQWMDPRRIIGLIITYRWLIIGLTCAATLVGFLYASLQTPLYRAQATILVDRGGAPIRELPNPGENLLQDQVYYASQLGVMESRAVAELALQFMPPSVAASFNRLPDPVGALLRHTVRVSQERNSALFTFSALSPDREAAAAIANAFAKAYREETVRENIQFISETNKLLAEQAKKLQSQYTEMQKQYAAYLSQTGSYYPKNQSSIVDSRIQSLELRKSELLIQKQALGAQMMPLIEVQKGELDPLAVAAVRQDDIIRGLVKQYQEGQKELAKMASQFTPEYPPYQKEAAELESIKGRIRAQAMTLLHAQQGQSEALSAELASLDKELADLKAQAIHLAEGSSQSLAMGSGVDALQKYLTLLNEKIQELDVAGKVLASRVSIVNPAVAPDVPYSPRKARTTLFAFLLGLMMSAGIIAAVQVLDKRIKDPDAIERKMGIPLVGLIPFYSKEDQWLVVEAFQALRTSIHYASDHRRKNILLIASPSSGEGKSSVAANLGIIAAKAGERVLLIDCDLRKSTLHQFFKLDPKRGLSDLLAAPEMNAKEFILETSSKGLSLLPAGPTPLNPPALFSMTRFHDLLEWGRKEYDWVFVDTPPLLAITDGSLIAEHVDLVLLVAAVKITQKPLLERALEMMQRLNKEVAGVVLNRFDWRAPDYYHYYYGKYHAKHYHYYGGNPAAPTVLDRAASTARKMTRRAIGQRKGAPRGPVV
jgi:tyrosine-protein kinase Etk/Wzc